MGEISEAMLDGTFCCDCGEYIGSENGFPTSCCQGTEEFEESNELQLSEIIDMIQELRAKSKIYIKKAHKNNNNKGPTYWKHMGCIEFCKKIMSKEMLDEWDN